MPSILGYSRFFTSLFALCFLATPAPATAAERDDWAFGEAVEQYQRGRWANAYGRFIALANNGDRDSARIALFMYRYGPRLYGSFWDASPDDIEVWEQLANQAPQTYRAAPVFKPKYC